MKLRFDPSARLDQFPILRVLRDRVLVFDGGMGTQIQSAFLTRDDVRGKQDFNELLVETRPEVIEAIHDRYFAAGADVVETDSFGGLPYVLAEFGVGHRSFELNRMAAQVGRRAAAKFATGERPRFVSGSVGPGTKLVTLGQISPHELFGAYRIYTLGLIAGGVDCLNIETCQDLLQMQLAVLAAREAMAEIGREVPIFCTVTIDATGAMLKGGDVAAAVATLEALPVDVVGLNCATELDRLQESVREFARLTTRPIMVMPSAGLPRNVSGRAVYNLTPAEFARFQARLVDELGVAVVGGCCGTTPEHVAAMAKFVAGKRPAERPMQQRP
jgi:5-methyltetrahydrofolate--homocysteine methyltransferase